MKKTRKKKKVNSKIQTIVSSILFVIIGYYILQMTVNLIKNPTNTVFVSEGSISKEETEIGYIIRNEEVVKGNNYKNGMEQIIDEGQKVAKDEPIFRYYSNGEDDIKNKIADLDKEIEKAIEENTDNLFSSDLKLIEAQISEKLYQFDDLNNIQKIQENKKVIDGYITKKAEIAGELSPKGSHLKELINERNENQRKLTEDSEYIRSPKSGLLSYKIDGLEETLTTADFSKYNKKFLDELNLKTGQIISTSSEKGKIVNNFECYIVCTTSTDEAMNAEIGDKVKIALPSTRTVDATIDYIIEEGEKERTLVLKFENGIEELLSYRKISFDIIWWDSRGYKIPNSAIITDNNLNYVIKTKAGYLSRILVKVVKQTDNYSIVKNYSSSEIKELRVDSNVKTSIMINDELVLNPTENQVDSTK